MTQTYKIMYTSGVTWEYTGTLIGAKRIATKHQTFEQFQRRKRRGDSETF